MKLSTNLNSISSKAVLGKNVHIGRNTVIHDNVRIEDNATICDNCTIGEPQADYYTNENYVNKQTVIGSNSLVRSHTIIYSGCEIGSNFNTGHRVTIREDSHVGNNCSIGTLGDIQGKVSIGNYVRLHSNVHIGQNSTIEDFVFIYPYVILTNDPTPPSDTCIGPTIRKYAQVATLSVLLPGVEIGEHALVGAGTVVTRDVPEYMLVLGNPGKLIKDVREIKNKEGNYHYPWPYNFDRGMPWKDKSYDDWLRNNSK